MRITIHQPSVALAPYVKYYWCLEAEGSEHRELVYPTGEMQMIFHYRQPFESPGPDGRDELQPGAFLAGQNLSAQSILAHGDSGAIGVLFYPAGASAFFPFSLHEICGRNIPLGEITSPPYFIEERLYESTGIEMRLQIIEDFLVKRLDTRHMRHFSLAEEAVRHTCTEHGCLEVHHLVDRAGISERQLERIFRRHTGLTPRSFIMISRLNYAIELMATTRSLTDIAYSAGFYDQPMFNRTFRKLTGLTPGEFRSLDCVKN